MDSHVCDQADCLSEIRSDLRIVKREQLSLVTALDRLCSGQEENAKETKSLNVSIQATIADNREFKSRLATAERDINHAFEEIRRVRVEDIGPMALKMEQVQNIRERLAVNDHIMTGIRALGAAVGVALVGIAVAAIYGKGAL